MSLESRVRTLRQEIEEVLVANGRMPKDVRLIAVSKTVGVPEVGAAVSAGLQDFGENRVEGLLEKQAAFPQATWHFIGNIQSRRIREIVSAADYIHSLFQAGHAERIDKAAEELGKVQNVLLEVNVSGEASKSGLDAGAVGEALSFCERLPHLKVCGFMTMAPRGDEASIRASFEGLRKLRDGFQDAGAADGGERDLHELSMGMSEDWPVALSAGATMIRIGRAIFDEAFEGSRG